jgi:hypothetical protein
MPSREPATLNPTGLLAVYAVDLLFDHPPPADLGIVRDRLAAVLAEEVGTSEPGCDVALSDSGIEIASRLAPDSGTPPTWVLTPAAPDPGITGAIEEAVLQSWWWPDARTVTPACATRWTLCDREMVTLDHGWRLSSFQRVLSATIAATGARAVHWRPTQQLLDAQELTTSLREHAFRSHLPGGLNVRFYRLAYDAAADAGSDATESAAQNTELLMDTLGLGALGLIDLQCHFRGLDPEAVAQMLHTTAAYLFEGGAMLRDGDTVQGPGARDRWLVRRATAIAAPQRELFELDPGFPFQAGTPGRHP